MGTVIVMSNEKILCKKFLIINGKKKFLFTQYRKDLLKLKDQIWIIF